MNLDKEEFSAGETEKIISLAMRLLRAKRTRTLDPERARTIGRLGGRPQADASVLRDEIRAYGPVGANPAEMRKRHPSAWRRLVNSGEISTRRVDGQNRAFIHENEQ